MKKQYGFFIDVEKCIGCFTCAMACKNQYHQPETVVWRQVYPISEEIYPYHERAFYSLACNHCENPTCLNVCPVKAYYKREDGIVVHEQDKCIGCGTCVDVCEFDAISLTQKLNVTVAQVNEALCKGCGTCATYCPTNAIDIRHFKDQQIESMLKAFLLEEETVTS